MLFQLQLMSLPSACQIKPKWQHPATRGKVLPQHGIPPANASPSPELLDRCWEESIHGICMKGNKQDVIHMVSFLQTCDFPWTALLLTRGQLKEIKLRLHRSVWRSTVKRKNAPSWGIGIIIIQTYICNQECFNRLNFYKVRATELRHSIYSFLQKPSTYITFQMYLQY